MQHRVYSYIINYYTIYLYFKCKPTFASPCRYVCPEGIQPCNRKNRDTYWRRYEIQETLYIGQWCFHPLQSRYLGTSHSSPNHHQLPHHIFLNLIDGLKSFLFQKWFEFWEKPEVTGHQIWALVGLSHLRDLMFHQKTLHKTWCRSGCIVVMKLPITSCPWLWPSESSK